MICQLLALATCYGSCCVCRLLHLAVATAAAHSCHSEVCPSYIAAALQANRVKFVFDNEALEVGAAAAAVHAHVCCCGCCRCSRASGPQGACVQPEPLWWHSIRLPNGAWMQVLVGPGSKESENAFVGGQNRWRYDTFVNWEYWWPAFPILVYFKVGAGCLRGTLLAAVLLARDRPVGWEAGRINGTPSRSWSTSRWVLAALLAAEHRQSAGSKGGSVACPAGSVALQGGCWPATGVTKHTCPCARSAAAGSAAGLPPRSAACCPRLAPLSPPSRDLPALSCDAWLCLQETQTKPEGQIHFFPIIMDGAPLSSPAWGSGAFQQP